MLYSKMMFKFTFGLFILVSLRVRDVTLDGTGLEQCYSVDSSQGISSDVLLEIECKNSSNTLKVSWSYAPDIDLWYIQHQLIGYQCYTGSKNLSILKDYSVITTHFTYKYYEIAMIKEINCVVKGCIETHVLGGGTAWFKLNTASCQFDTPPTMPDITDDVMNTSTMISTTVYLSSIIESPFISSSSDHLMSPSVTASEIHHLSISTPLSSIKKDSSKATTSSSSTAKMSKTISTTTSPPINNAVQVQVSTTTDHEGITSSSSRPSSEAAPPTTEQPSSPQLNIIVVIVIIVMVCMTAVCAIIFSITGFHRRLNHISSKKTIQEVDAVSTEFEVVAYSIYSTVPESPSLLTLIEEPRVSAPGPSTHQYDSNDSSHQCDSTDPSHLYEPIDPSFLTAPTSESSTSNIIILNNSGTLQSNSSTTSNCITPEHNTIVSETDQHYSPGINSEDDASFIISNTEIPPTPNNGMIMRETYTEVEYLNSPDSSYTPFPSSSSCGYISDHSYERSSIYIARLDSTTSDYHSSTSSHRRSSSMTSNYIHCNT